MDDTNVPQHNISTYADNKKVMYALDTKGRYTVVPSSGWDVEEEATKQALGELERLANIAYSQVAAGTASPLYFHMYACRMDLQTLARSTGFFQWRIKRHFKPEIFNKLSSDILTRYGDTLGISIEKLCKLPAGGQHSG
jgi:hypothetical protein